MDMDVYAEKACAFADNLPFPDGSFDAIVAGEFIEHVPGASVDATLHEFFRVLRLRGTLLLTTPNPYYVRNKLQGLSVITEPAHVSQHYPETLELRLKMAGFSRIWIKGSGKVTRYLGEILPLRLYGSFLCSALKW
jgi:ubiquinone/menaquinone biosynthesis C-methylase UbiE